MTDVADGSEILNRQDTGERLATTFGLHPEQEPVTGEFRRAISTTL